MKNSNLTAVQKEPRCIGHVDLATLYCSCFQDDDALFSSGDVTVPSVLKSAFFQAWDAGMEGK